MLGNKMQLKKTRHKKRRKTEEKTSHLVEVVDARIICNKTLSDEQGLAIEC